MIAALTCNFFLDTTPHHPSTMISTRDYRHLIIDGSFPVYAISNLAPYSGLILSIVLVILYLVKFYILELFLLKRLYGSKYTDLNDIIRRGFLNNHIAAATKAIILVVALYPSLTVIFGKAHFHAPFAYGSHVTLGDILLICAQMLVGMFIFELIYRVKISPIVAAHHIGGILIAQTAITLSVNHDQDASIAFLLCSIWGTYFFPSVLEKRI